MANTCGECKREVNRNIDGSIAEVVIEKKQHDIEEIHYAHVGGGIHVIVAIKPRGEDVKGALCPSCLEGFRERKRKRDEEKL